MAGRPVARVVSSALARIGLVGCLAGLAGVVGLVASALAVHHLVDEVAPAVSANQAVYQDLTDMSAAVEAWASAGLPTSSDDYQQATLRLAAHEQEVRSFADGDDALEAAVVRQEDAARAWIDAYAEPRMAAPGAAESTAREVRARTSAFGAVRSAHQATTRLFDQRARSADEAITLRLRGAVLVVVLVGLASWVLVARSRRRLDAELSAPLLTLERVVQRMADGDHEVRALTTGPREVEAVARALNDLADAQTRARAVETWIEREIRTLDTARDDFVANVSHELRTPLTTISGYLEMVADEFEAMIEPRHARMLEATRRNVARLEALIDDLLALQRAEGSHQPLEPVELGALVAEVVMDVKITAARRDIEVVVDAPARPLVVPADRAMLHRALLNVVVNAVKFSHDAGRVEVRLAERPGRATITVADHGIGIPAADLDRLGTRFFRASNAVTQEIAGTGLGVRIMQTIVDRHGGSADFESEEGRGTTVTVRLPRYAGAAPVRVIPVPPATSAEPAPEPAS